MAVTHHTSSRTIRGITYAYNATFVCYAANEGRAGSEGNGGTAKALTKGETYTFKGYAIDDDTGGLTSYPYLVADSLGNTRGWYKENVFPYKAYTISYNANGGSGAPGKQTKTYGTAVTISKTTPTRTGYAFNGWNTKADGTGTNYSAGSTYSSNADLTLYAKWKANTYTVSYNANGTGVSNLPGNQTKTYGTTLTLSSTKPTRANYTFKGWGTSAGATTVAYSPEASYTKNEKLTLYAIWELGYTKPRIKNIDISRTNDKGLVDEQGTCIFLRFDWECDFVVSTISARWKMTTASTWTTLNLKGSETENKTSGSLYSLLGTNFSIMSSFTIEITISDSQGSTTQKRTINSLAFTIHAKEGGDGVAFGKTAELADTADFNFKGKFRKEVNFDQNVMFGNKTEYHDGNTGVYINKAGYMHLQRATTDGNPYIGFYVDSATSADAQIICKRETNTANENGYDKYLYFSGADRYAFDQNVQTQKSIYMGLGSASSAYAIITKWKDNANHNLVERFADGLTSAFGWVGSSTYATITKIRGQTCQYQNAAGPTTLSDERLKKDFTNLDKWSAFYDSLEPIAFKMKNGNSGRYHIGFKAQQVEQALNDAGLTTQDFAGFVKSKYIFDNDDPEGSKVYEEAGIKPSDDEYGLIYTEFVALNTYEIQKLRKKNDELQKQVESLEERLKAVETLLIKE